MRWSLLLVLTVLAASCTSAGAPNEEPAAQSPDPIIEDDAPATPFELLPASGDSVDRIRQGAVFVESVLVAGEQDVAVVFIGDPEGSLVDDPCAGEYEIEVTESADVIMLTVHVLVLADAGSPATCPAEGFQRAMMVTLDGPIGTRTVVDGKDNGDRPVVDPAAFLWPQALPEGWITGFREVAQASLVSRYGAESNPADGIVLLAGPIDNNTWNMTTATSDPGAIVEPVNARADSDGTEALIRSDSGQLTIAFDEQSLHYRATARGAVTEAMLSAFVADLAIVPNARGLEIPYAAEPPQADVEVGVPTPTAIEVDPSIAWSASESVRDVSNYLEALRAGAYEQAAWPAWGNGILFDGQVADETGAEFLSRSCAGGVCTGPYLLRGQPGIINDETMQALAVVVVTHFGTGQQSEIVLLTFEGQRIIGNLPPLGQSPNEASLSESLFGTSPPNYVVVERFEAFEIWDGGDTTWVTNWHAETTSQIEGDVVVAATGTFSLTDPQQAFAVACPRIIERAGVVIAIDQCVTDQWNLLNLATGEPADAPVEYEPAGEAKTPWFSERGGTVVTGVRDAEGNLSELVSTTDVDLLSGDYAGMLALSIDGAHVAYVDHGDPASLSVHWSPVVVVREVSTGNEVGRWTLEGAASCLQFAVDWVIACEADGSTLGTGGPDQLSLAAINVTTGEINRVPTATKVFLPIRPS